MIRKCSVVPHVGTWIEISIVLVEHVHINVVPHVGTWIEIFPPVVPVPVPMVVPHVGTWIEITHSFPNCTNLPSFPTWERELKLAYLVPERTPACRSPRGNVNWNQTLLSIQSLRYVVPHVGTWIEMSSGLPPMVTQFRRSPRGNVNWNVKWLTADGHAVPSFPTWERELKSVSAATVKINKTVVPHVGTWIEIIVATWLPPDCPLSFPTWERELKLISTQVLLARKMSFPTWERGLKYTNNRKCRSKALSFPTWERGLKYWKT